MILNEKLSFIADETIDIGHHEQLSIVLRYFNKHTKWSVEQFICIQQIKSVDFTQTFLVE